MERGDKRIVGETLTSHEVTPLELAILRIVRAEPMKEWLLESLILEAACYGTDFEEVRATIDDLTEQGKLQQGGEGFVFVALPGVFLLNQLKLEHDPYSKDILVARKAIMGLVREHPEKRWRPIDLVRAAHDPSQNPALPSLALGDLIDDGNLAQDPDDQHVGLPV
jgi:hypothetical protein